MDIPKGISKPQPRPGSPVAAPEKQATPPLSLADTSSLVTPDSSRLAEAAARARVLGSTAPVSIALSSEDQLGIQNQFEALITTVSSDEKITAFLAENAVRLDINGHDANGRTPLIHAAFNHRALIVERLLTDYRADPNKKTASGAPALHIAINRYSINPAESYKILFALQKAKVDTTATNSADQTCFSLPNYASTTEIQDLFPQGFTTADDLTGLLRFRPQIHGGSQAKVLSTKAQELFMAAETSRDGLDLASELAGLIAADSPVLKEKNSRQNTLIEVLFQKEGPLAEHLIDMALATNKVDTLNQSVKNRSFMATLLQHGARHVIPSIFARLRGESSHPEVVKFLVPNSEKQHLLHIAANHEDRSLFGETMGLCLAFEPRVFSAFIEPDSHHKTPLDYLIEKKNFEEAANFAAFLVGHEILGPHTDTSANHKRIDVIIKLENLSAKAGHTAIGDQLERVLRSAISAIRSPEARRLLEDHQSFKLVAEQLQAQDAASGHGHVPQRSRAFAPHSFGQGGSAGSAAEAPSEEKSGPLSQAGSGSTRFPDMGLSASQINEKLSALISTINQFSGSVPAVVGARLEHERELIDLVGHCRANGIDISAAVDQAFRYSNERIINILLD